MADSVCPRLSGALIRVSLISEYRQSETDFPTYVADQFDPLLIPLGDRKRSVAVQETGETRKISHGVRVINRETANGSFSKRGTGQRNRRDL